MLQFEAYDELERLFRKAESLQIVENTGLSLELYPCLSDFLKKTGRVQSFAKYTRQYFAAYEKEQSNNKQVTIRVMELQDRLLSIEKEQEKMRASNRELEALALYDSMTNLANRTLLKNMFPGSLRRQSRRESFMVWKFWILTILSSIMISTDIWRETAVLRKWQQY